MNPGVQVLTPNPFSSGGARWNLMAAYGSQVQEGKSDAQAQEYLKQLLGNASLQAPSASDSMTAFTQGKGDVALAYENEAIAAQKAGEKVDYVIPKDTIQIQTPIATTTDAGTTAQDFVKWLDTPEAQQIWADNGYRPVNKKVLEQNAKEFPTPPGLFTIDKLGGWDQGDDQVLRPQQRHRHQGRAGPGGLHERMSTAETDTSSVAPPRSAAWPRLGGAALGRGLVVAYLSVIVLIPIAALVAQSTDGGWSSFWSAISNPEAWWALKWTVIASLIVVVNQRLRRDGDRVGPGPGQVPREGRPQRGDRPAVRAADGRRRDHAPCPLRAREPDRRQCGLHEGRGHHGAAVRDPAVRGAGCTARADGAGPSRWRRRRRRLGPRRSRPSAGSSCRAFCRRSSPAARWRSRGRSASSGRSSCSRASSPSRRRSCRA